MEKRENKSVLEKYFANCKKIGTLPLKVVDLDPN